MFNKYPYTDFHELNLDWILSKIHALETEMNEFEVVNKITFSGAWDITKQYPAWTIVDDGGMGYVSIVPVPSGVSISNTDYWRLIADYTILFANLNQRITDVENALSYNKINDHTKYAVWIGDSYTGAASLGADQDKRFSTQVSNMLGVTEKNYAVGSCGYIAGSTPYLAQVNNAIADFTNNGLNKNDVLYVFIVGARNDGPLDATGANKTMITNAAQNVFTTAEGAFPNATLVIIPMLWDATFMPIKFLNNINWIEDAAYHQYSKRRTVIDNGYKWLSGMFNYILYQSGANVHPNIFGHCIIARHIYSALNGVEFNESSVVNFFSNDVSTMSDMQGYVAKRDGFVDLYLHFKPTIDTPVMFEHSFTDLYIEEWYMGTQRLYIDLIPRDTGDICKAFIDMSVTKTGDTAGYGMLQIRKYSGNFNLNHFYYMKIRIPNGVFDQLYTLN